MRILYIHSLMFHQRTWRRVVDRLKQDGIDLRLVDQAAAAGVIGAPETGGIDLLVADLAVGMPGFDRLLEAGRSIPHRMGLSHQIPGDFTTFGMDTASEFRQYLSAVGLDAFESLAWVLRQMKMAGYDVGAAPKTGREIRDAIMSRKAVAEFRWTTVDEIVRKGGALHLMDEAEYAPWFNALAEPSRLKVLEDWDAFPGQGMSHKDNGKDVLVITGIRYGNIRIMAQPKRGCYGAKRTGEVCRILHDPALAPPHHWLATYKYIQDHSDAVVHFGADGALEYLPGKQVGLSDACFPEISMGE
ncbi:MAG: hypothetical protein HKP58_13475 [Desulfatitalea sp.]|nr:cobaltochelatase subunit CobN [Desulfatitalea sp.]NNK01411.1 hypothetical protein [Desulfatitalea sp.]